MTAFQSGGPRREEVPFSEKMGAANSFHSFHPLLYTCVVFAADPNWFCAAVAHTFLCAGLSSLCGHSQLFIPHSQDQSHIETELTIEGD